MIGLSVIGFPVCADQLLPWASASSSVKTHGVQAECPGCWESHNTAAGSQRQGSRARAAGFSGRHETEGGFVLHHWGLAGCGGYIARPAQVRSEPSPPQPSEATRVSPWKRTLRTSDSN